MAFPFQQAPTFSELVTRLTTDFGCELQELDGDLYGPRGKVRISYLSRVMDGVELYSEPLPMDLNERVSPDSARRLIMQLKLPAEAVWIWAGSPSDIG